MGKGKGKSSNWASKIPYNIIFIELKNVRVGRGKYFFKQLNYKLPGKHNIVYRFFQKNPIPFFKNSYTLYEHFY